MKKSDLFKIGVLLMATTLGTTGCSFGEDEKKPEIVVDPAEKTIEYYIAGKVTEGTTALSGVEVKAGEVTATTDAEGAYKLTVDSKKVYTVTFSKEGYMSIDNATATIADNAANRSMVSLSVKLSKKAPEKEVKADAEEEVVVTDKGDSNISQAEAAVIIPPQAIETTTTVSVTPYEEPAAVTTTVTPGNNVETPVAIANIEVETAKEVTLAKPVTLAIINKASEHTTFRLFKRSLSASVVGKSFVESVVEPPFLLFWPCDGITAFYENVTENHTLSEILSHFYLRKSKPLHQPFYKSD